MMITQSPSPNFDDRKTVVRFLVLHYTGMETGAAALDRLCDPAAKVSAHYLVETDGRVFQMVDENMRAWHAGVSEWAGMTDLNSASVGIEIVNGGHDWRDADGGLPPYPDVQINAVIALSKAVMNRHSIAARDVLGHSDIAPTRKQDPGEHFPWGGLAAAGIGQWPKGIEDDRRVLFEPDQRDRGVAIAQRGLAHIGYGARVSGILDTDTQDIIKALQRRYRPGHIDGIIDMQTMDIIKALVEMNSAA